MLGGGLKRSDLIIIAGQSSFGKSALALNIALHAAEQYARVALASLEMSAEGILGRLVASQTNISTGRIYMGLLTKSETQREFDAHGYLSDLPLHIAELHSQHITEFQCNIRRWNNKEPIDLLIVDYIQLIAGSSGRSESRVMEMGEISRSLKSIARELDIPVLAISQLNWPPENRVNHRPILSDLREIGGIEQDADVVAFLHREDMCVSQDEWKKRRPSDEYPANIAELIVAKHQNGPTGSIYLYFHDQVMRFESLEHKTGGVT